MSWQQSLPRTTMVVTVLAVAMVLAACTSGGADEQPPSSSPPSAAPAQITISPDPSTPISVTTPVSVTVEAGTIVEATLLTPQGRPVDSVQTPDGMTWKTTEPLGYGSRYALHVVAANPAGTQVSTDVAITTLAPGNRTELTFTDANGTALSEDQKYGVGNIVVAHFDEPIPDKAAAEESMRITTDPPVAGAWRWIDDQNAHWRPEKYYAPGTVVTAQANIYGRDLGAELYGQSDTSASFTVGDAHVAVSDDNTKTITVSNNGQVVKTMPTSMGMGGTETVDGQELSFWTPSGIYTVLEKANPVVMDSSTYGLPVNSRLGYKETVSWAVRISPDGIYLHQLDSTVWAQGNTNTSHGCLNLNGDLAQWFYQFSQVGDIVEVVNTGGPPQAAGNNGDWTIPWEQWAQR